MSAIELHDLDDAEMVAAIESAFRIEIAGPEFLACYTAGDVFSLVASKVPYMERGPLPCPTASAFRRLRAALREAAPGVRIEPETPLSVLMPGAGRRAWLRKLARSTGLNLPRVQLARRHHPAFNIAAGCVVGAIAYGAGAHGRSYVVGALTIAALTVASWIYRAGAAGLGSDATVGDFATFTAALNPRLLANRDGVMRRRDIWTAVEGIIRYSTGFSGPIDRRTRFKVT